MRKLLNKIVYSIYKWSSNYVYIHLYVPKHADKDFWDDDFV